MTEAVCSSFTKVPAVANATSIDNLHSKTLCNIRCCAWHCLGSGQLLGPSNCCVYFFCFQYWRLGHNDGLENKFKWQVKYTRPNDNRWILKDHFYVHRSEDAATGVSIAIFNVGTNDADIHGAEPW
ncbi:hypothetical protein PsorP6_000238 [Peronosclerospora sorghi]|uniref:Uncharacterized protein n=1 Tax=Peronosclerospora sorghi TaxID=230839 RepID=A0ACC0WRU8_9STRA|nr:hypothetical protein PsorP6_000238 [Peronosclerospora sorghi]